MKNSIRKLTESSFVKNVAIMATGTTGAQIVTVGLSPAITRLYGPEAFGILGTFIALTKVIIPNAGLTYPTAIVLPKSDKNAKGLMKLSLYITFIISLITILILLFFQSTIVDIFQIKEVAPFLYLIPLATLLMGFMQVMEQWIIRTNQFSINAKASFLQSIIINGGKISLGLVYPSAVILVILQTFNNGVKGILITFFAGKSLYSKDNYSEEKSLNIIDLAKKYRDFPIYRAPERLFSSFSQSLPVLLLSSFFGPAAAGFYNIGRNVLSLPSRLIGNSIGDVFYPRIAQAANNKENLSRLITQATLVLVVIGIFPFGIVVAFGPYLFAFVFGAEWLTAGEYARWIAILSFSGFINKPSVKSMPVIKAQRFYLIFTFLRLVIPSLALIMGSLVFNSDIIAVALFSITSFIFNILLILLTIYFSYKKQP